MGNSSTRAKTVRDIMKTQLISTNNCWDLWGSLSCHTNHFRTTRTVIYFYYWPVSLCVVAAEVAFVPGFIRRRILCQAVGLGRAVGGAVFWTDFLFGAVCRWQLQAGPDTLPLLRCISDGQTPLLLDEHVHTNRRAEMVLRSSMS